MAIELSNPTGLPALLFRTLVDDTRMAAAIVARVTYQVGAGGHLTRAEVQPWRVSPAPWDGPAGPMPSDDVFYRGGVDLFVFGDAWAPGGRGAVTSQVRVQLADRLSVTIAVYGDRVWTGRAGGLKISRPAPFVSMPLTLGRAYGGRAAWDGLQIASPANPEGRGLCLSEDRAAGTPLPNLEDPTCLVRRWSDTPEPVGTALCPRWFGPRVRAGTTFDQQGRLTALRGRLFNDAFPALIATAVEPGDAIQVDGVTPDGPLRFIVPPCPLLAQLAIGATRVEAPLRIDQIGIEPALRRVFITYRHPFRYVVTARQRRACALRELARRN
jgi:hypothetical protein